MSSWFPLTMVLILSTFLNLPTVQSVNCVLNGFNLSSLGEMSFNTTNGYHIKFCGIPPKCLTSMACQIDYETSNIFELIHNVTSMELISTGGGRMIFKAYGSNTWCQTNRTTIVNVTCDASSFSVTDYTQCVYLMTVPVPPSMHDRFCPKTPASPLSTTSIILIGCICILGILAVSLAIMHCRKQKPIKTVVLTTDYYSIGETANPTSSRSSIQRQRMNDVGITARVQPGNRFLDIIPNCNDTTQDAIITSLKYYADSHKLDKTVVVLFEEKVNYLIDEGHSPEKSLSLALLWLYSFESWVYLEINNLLRHDSNLMNELAPCIYGLILSFKQMDERYLFFGTVYRRTKLTDKQINFYLQQSTFVWSSFTSTTTEFSPDITFGDVLFVISIKKEHRFYAISLEDISAVPLEKEILLLPNIGFVVTSVKKGTEIDYPNVKVLFELELKYVCIS